MKSEFQYDACKLYSEKKKINVNDSVFSFSSINHVGLYIKKIKDRSCINALVVLIGCRSISTTFSNIKKKKKKNIHGTLFKKYKVFRHPILEFTMENSFCITLALVECHASRPNGTYFVSKLYKRASTKKKSILTW